MRYFGLGLALFSFASLILITQWYANNPNFLMGHPSIDRLASKEPSDDNTGLIRQDDTDFIKQIEASLQKDVSRPPTVNQYTEVLTSKLR